MPRKPKKEPPHITIRWQRRQMAQMERIIAELRSNGEGLRAQIGCQVLKLSETETELFDMAWRLDDVSIDLTNTKARAQKSAERLAYLEGFFYAQEKTASVQQAAVLPAGRDIPRDQAQTHATRGPGNQEGLQARRQAAESAGFDPGAAGFGPTAGEEVRRDRADYRPYPGKRSMEHVEITDVRDGLTRWAAW